MNFPAPTNYIFQQGAHEIFKLFDSLLGIHSSFFTPDGTEIYSGADRKGCGYCCLLHRGLGIGGSCHAQNLRAIEQAKETGAPVSYCCHGGMQEMTMPICCENNIIGYAIIGQFRDTTQLRSPYADQWLKKFGNNELQQAYEQSPVLSDEKIEGLKLLFYHSIRRIESEYMIVMKDYDLIHPIIVRIHKQPEVPVSMIEASQIAGRSESTINRLFKNITGHPLKQYQINVLLKKAENLMLNSPHLPAAQIAAQLGFSDPLYFSKLFKKHTGRSPSQFRKENNPVAPE